jgi:hypothetical protein
MIEIIPCLYDFKLDEENMCSKCHKKIVVITKDTQIENSSLQCGMMKLSNNDNNYFGNTTRQFLLAALIGFGANLFVLSASAQDTITKIQQELQPTEQVIKIDSTTKISGVLIRKSTNEPIPFVNVYLEINGVLYGDSSKIDGSYEIKLPFNLTALLIENLELKILNVSFKEILILIPNSKFNSTINMGQTILEIEEDLEIIGIYLDPEKTDILEPDNYRKTTKKRSNKAPLPPRQ